MHLDMSLPQSFGRLPCFGLHLLRAQGRGCVHEKCTYGELQKFWVSTRRTGSTDKRLTPFHHCESHGWFAMHPVAVRLKTM